MNLLAAIDSFIKVVETGSVVGAAKRLGVSAAAVSQTLNRLEAHLGTRLLQRTTRSMALTERGALYYAKVQRIAFDLESAQAAITQADEDLQGRLCVASTSAFGRHVLAPLIAEFATRYPRLAEFVARPYLDAGQLIPLLERTHAPSESYAEPLDIYACVQSREAMTPKVRAFLSYLDEALTHRWPSLTAP